MDNLGNESPLDEAELLNRLKGGDEEAFTVIYHRYWERLFFVAHKRLHSLEDAKEAVQDVFLTLWQKREYLQIQILAGYLAAMVRYDVYKRLAHRDKMREGVRSLQRETTGVEAPFDIENKQFLEILHDLSYDLPEKCRIVFINHKLLDQPLDQVATQLGISMRTAEDYVTRALKIMRKHREGLSYFLLFLLP